MSSTCPLCFSTIADDNPGLLAEQLNKALNGRWSSADSDDPRYGWPVGKVFHVPQITGLIEVVAKKATYDSGDIDHDRWYGGELPQGTEFETWVVLKVGDGFFKKVGTGDSYGEVDWNGPCRPVQATPKTVTVYEFI